MAEKFISFPVADLDVNNLPNTLTGALLHSTTNLSGLTNGVARRVFVLQNPSPSFTPAAAGGFSDNFNRANSSTLGANWVVYQDNWFGDNANPGFGISGNAAIFGSGTAFGAEFVRTTTAQSGNAFAQFTMSSRTGADVRFAVGLINPTTEKQILFYDLPATGLRYLKRRNNILGSHGGPDLASEAVNTSNGQVVRVERIVVDGSTIRYRALVNGSQVLTYDDTDVDRVTGDVHGVMMVWSQSTSDTITIEDFSQGAA